MTIRLSAAALLIVMLAACGQATAPENATETAIDVAGETITETMTETPEAPAMVEAIGPVVGEPAPAVVAVDASGATVDFASLAGSEGTIIAFNRSAEWCPYCQKQMRELETIKTDLANQGWTLTALTYDDPEILSEFAAEDSITYPLLSDTDSATIKAFSLLNKEMEGGTKYYGIPHPAVIFIGTDGVVKGILREAGYKTRPSNADVLDMATKLTNAG